MPDVFNPVKWFVWMYCGGCAAATYDAWIQAMNSVLHHDLRYNTRR